VAFYLEIDQILLKIGVKNIKHRWVVREWDFKSACTQKTNVMVVNKYAQIISVSITLNIK